jgi:acid phosphatase (class A)
MILPSPPAVGSAADHADRQIFMATRRLRGSPRWQIADIRFAFAGSQRS